MKIRLQRHMADCGVASRRACEELITQGRVRINGEVRTEMPVMVDPAVDLITVDETVLTGKAGAATKQIARGISAQQTVYYLLNKPKGILVTNYDPADRKTVSELMTGVPERVFPVGRLDMDSRGALLMTNDGELANRLTHPRFGIEKTYIVAVDGAMSPADLEKIKRGIWLGPEHRNPAKEGANGPRGSKTERFRLKVIGREKGGVGGRTLLEIKLAEGKNSEIRRVMARLGHPVRDLNRVAIAGKITIRGVEVGEYRKLTDEEVKWLYHASSPEYHDRERASTQAWYEAKEAEKERKRLETSPSAPAARKAPFRPAFAKTGARPKTGKTYGSSRPARGPFGKPRTPFGKPRGPFSGPRSSPGAGPRTGLDGTRRGPRPAGPKTTRPVNKPTARPTGSQPSHPLGDQARQDD